MRLLGGFKLTKQHKKVGILTLNGYVNYGNRLQNYALQQVLISLGFEVETIRVNRSNKPEISERLKSISNLHDLLEKIKNRLNYYLQKNVRHSRERIFREFSHKHLNETKNIISNDCEARALNSFFDYFVTGSDQVWNPNNLHGTSFFFLTFADKDKKIAYAPSFGVSEIENKDKINYKKWLLNMDKLSVREEAGAKIIKELIGKDVPVLVDPTLLLTKKDWLKISKEAKNKPQNKYLLTYFLGGIPCEYQNQVDIIAKQNNFDIINLGDIKDKDTYITGPSEFIDYINNCSVFCTDSFHGVVFSIILEKPFIVYERIGTTSMYSRINTLLDKFDLNFRKAENVSSMDLFHIGFLQLKAKLEFERKKSFDYLKKSLEIKDEK